jgi:methanogenic corrinoid protein MtbC1
MALEVIPALLRIRTKTRSGDDPRWVPPPGAVADLAALSVSPDAEAAVRQVLATLRLGVPVTVLCDSLLAPAARMLGEQWVEDERNFAEVTLGMMRLHEALRAAARAAPPGIHVAAGLTPRALLVPVPGEGHVFGAAVLGEHFTQAGWEVWGTTPRVVDELRDWVASDWFDVAGLSAATEARIPALRDSIAALRETSCNPDIAIFVGGRLFSAQPTLAETLGVDWVSTDAAGAVVAARQWVSQHNDKPGHHAP